MRKVERTEEQREQKKYRSEAKAVAPTAQDCPEPAVGKQKFTVVWRRDPF